MNTVWSWAERWGIPIAAVRELLGFVQTETASSCMSEAAIQSGIELAAANLGDVLWRNNVGAYRNGSGRMVRYGLANNSKEMNELTKSHDLIGITQRVVRQHNVGETWGVFTSIEVKAGDWVMNVADPHTLAQLNYASIVKGMGGISGIINHPDQYRALVCREN